MLESLLSQECMLDIRKTATKIWNNELTRKTSDVIG
jgi:hypothetical protein